MESENREYAFWACEYAYFALRQGRYGDANALAREAVRLASDWEVPWLILAASSDPENSITYLKTALEINASSPYARQGMRWAVHRLRTSQAFLQVNNPYAPYQKPATPLFDTAEKISDERQIIVERGKKLLNRSSNTIASFAVNLVVLLLFMLASLSVGHLVYSGNNPNMREQFPPQYTPNPLYIVDVPSTSIFLNPLPASTPLIPLTNEPQQVNTEQTNEIASMLATLEAETPAADQKRSFSQLSAYLSAQQEQILNQVCQDCAVEANCYQSNGQPCSSVEETAWLVPIPEGCEVNTNIGYVMMAFELINQLRANLNLNRLVWNDQLALAASKHSVDMACNHFFAHINPDEANFSDRISAEGYIFTALGENIFAGDDIYNSPAAMYRAWFNSQVHFQVMIHPVFTEVGIGYVYCPGSQYGGYITADFGSLE